MRNRIINGDMRIDQRNAGAVFTSSNTYFLDRWYFGNSQASKGTFQQNAGSVTPPAGFDNYLGFTSSSAYSVLTADEFFFRQPVEGYNFSDFAFGTASAKACTVSFWVRSSLTGTFGAALKNSAQNRTYPFTYTISAANTWEYKTQTIPGDTSGTWVGGTNGIGCYLIFALGAGSGRSGTAGAWATADVNSVIGATSVVGTNGATFYITGVQLEPGSVATPFERRSYGQELALCQRYFYRHAEGTSRIIGYGTYWTSAQFEAGVFFPVTMRTTPTLVQTTGTNYYSVATNSTYDYLDSLSTANGNANGLLLFNNSQSAGTAGHGGRLETNNAAAQISFSAEL